jgi:hypothetical protein
VAVTLYRKRTALIRVVAERRFRSLAAVTNVIRRFTAAALAPGSLPVLKLPPSPTWQVATSASNLTD